MSDADDQDIAELMQLRAIKDLRITTRIGDRMRPGALQQGDAYPAVWYEITNSDSWGHLGGASGAAQSRVRFGCVSKLKREANAIAKTLDDLFNGFTGYIDEEETVYVSDCTRDNKWDTKERPPEGGSDWLYTRNLDFIVTHSEPVPTLTVFDADAVDS